MAVTSSAGYRKPDRNPPSYFNWIEGLQQSSQHRKIHGKSVGAMARFLLNLLGYEPPERQWLRRNAHH